MRLIVAITGSSGAVYGIRLLEALRRVPGVEIHLVLSKGGKLTLRLESNRSVKDVEALAHHVHSDSDIGATIASGSFRTAGMIVAPCSMKTLSGIVASYADNLVVRAADVVLKERRRLVLMPRETPLHVGHCRLLLQAAEMGAIIAPPMPAFYNRPRSLEEAVDHSVGRVLDLFDIESDLVKRWRGARDEVGGRHESDAIVAAMNAPQRSSVLDAVPMAPSDPILGVSEAFVRDANPRKVNLGQATSAIESKAWKPFRTEFYPTYDFLSIQAELRGRSSGGG